MVKLKNAPFWLKWGKKIQARKAILPSTPVCMIGMMIVSGYLFKKMSKNPLPSGFLSRHGVKEKHQPLYQKLVLTMAQKEGFVSPLSTLVGPLGSKAALRPYSPPRGSNSSAPPNFLCKNKKDSDFSKSLSWRRRRDLSLLSRHSSVRSALRPHRGLIHLLAVQIPPRLLIFFAKTKETLISQSLFLGAEGGI